MGGDGCAHEREVGEALGDEEDGEVGARGGVRGFAESRDVDGVPLVFLDLHGATDVDVESVVGAELDVLRLGRVAALDADRLAVAVVVDRLDVHAELDADALGVAAAAAAELAAARPAARHLPEGDALRVVVRAEQVEQLPHVLGVVGDEADVATATLRERLLENLHRDVRARTAGARETCEASTRDAVEEREGSRGDLGTRDALKFTKNAREFAPSHRKGLTNSRQQRRGN